MKVFWLAAAAALTVSAAQKIEFEAASVKPISSAAMSPQMRQMLAFVMEAADPANLPPSSPGRITLRNEPLARLIARAWSVRAAQVSGPKWMTEDAFDIEATFPPNTSSENLHQMLQTLLESRFGIKLHHVHSTAKGYSLTVAKDGVKLTPAASRRVVSAGTGAPPPPPPPPDGMLPGGQRSLYTNISMHSFAAIVSGMAEAPVVDMTGLPGKYDVTVDTSRDTAESAGRTIFDVVRELGLRLESGKVQIDLLVVDQVNRAAAPN